MIEGLEDGNVAVLSKVHHAAIDGASGNELTVALLDLTPEIAEHEPEEEWVPDRVPTDAELLGYAATSLARQPVRVAKARRQDRRRRPARCAAATASSPNLAAAAVAVLRAAHVVQHGASRRAAASPTRRVSLPTVKAVKNATGATVNDVVLALCAGALRRYLDDHGEQPDGPLVAMVPVSVRSDDEKDAHGQPGHARCSPRLATDIDDPVERLEVIHECMAEVKEQQKAHRRRHAAATGPSSRRPALAGTGRPPLLAHEDGRPPPAAVQRHHLQRARPAVPAVLDRRPHGRQLPGRARSSTAAAST